VGLPPAAKNEQWWPLYSQLLGNAGLKPRPELIDRCARHVQKFLRIRYSSPLFRIADPAFIKKQLIYYNAGQKQLHGVIAMELNSSYTKGDEGIYDTRFRRIVVVMNGQPELARIKFPISGGWSCASPVIISIPRLRSGRTR